MYTNKRRIRIDIEYKDFLEVSNIEPYINLNYNDWSANVKLLCTRIAMLVCKDVNSFDNSMDIVYKIINQMSNNHYIKDDIEVLKRFQYEEFMKFYCWCKYGSISMIIDLKGNIEGVLERDTDGVRYISYY